MGKSKTLKRKELQQADLNKVVRIFVDRASMPAPRMTPSQEVYIHECSCFMISTVHRLYPNASKINPTSLTLLLSKMLHSKCGKSKSKSSRKTGGSLAARSRSITLRKGKLVKIIRKASILPGLILFLYSVLLTRAFVEQMNAKNPFREGHYEIFDQARVELDETMTVEITQKNIMRWVRHPSRSLKEVSNHLSMAAVRIVGTVTQSLAQGLEQRVRDQCLSESMAMAPEPEPVFEVPLDAEEPVGRWNEFKAMTWSALSGISSGADQIAVKLAKAHLDANNLFDMPGCISRVQSIEFQKMMDKIKNDHATIKLDIEMWAKKGQNDMSFILHLFMMSIGLMVTSLGFNGYAMISGDNKHTLEGRPYNMNQNALAEEPMPLRGPLQPAQMPRLESENAIKERIQQQAMNDMRRRMEEIVRPAANRAQAQALASQRIQQQALNDAQRRMEKIVRPAANRAQAAREERQAQIQRDLEEAAILQEIENKEARRRQEEFEELRKRTNAKAAEFRERY